MSLACLGLHEKGPLHTDDLPRALKNKAVGAQVEGNVSSHSMCRCRRCGRSRPEDGKRTIRDAAISRWNFYTAIGTGIRTTWVLRYAKAKAIYDEGRATKKNGAGATPLFPALGTESLHPLSDLPCQTPNTKVHTPGHVSTRI